jgi:hypothetical protein
MPFEAWLATTAAAVETTVKVNAPNRIPIIFSARLSAMLARPFSSSQERDGRRMVSLYLWNFA